MQGINTTDKLRPTHWACPISGKPLFILDRFYFDILDGPSIYTTWDRDFMYEHWPRQPEGLFQLVGSDRIFYFEEGVWVEGEFIFDEFVDIKDPFFNDRKNRYKVWKDAQSVINWNSFRKDIATKGWSTRVMAKTISPELLSVQPMKAPTGFLFFLDTASDKKSFYQGKIKEYLQES